MLTVYEDTEKLFLALRAGASGCLLKSSLPARLFAAIRDVQEGGSPLSSHIAREYHYLVGADLVKSPAFTRIIRE